jgi:hypothetical protein
MKDIIKKILIEEKMGQDTLGRLLQWYDTWTSKLAEYVAANDYSKIIDIHFKNGIGLLSSIKNTIKNNPELESELKEKFEILKSQLIVINNSRKLIDTLK